MISELKTPGDGEVLNVNFQIFVKQYVSNSNVVDLDV